MTKQGEENDQIGGGDHFFRGSFARLTYQVRRGTCLESRQWVRCEALPPDSDSQSNPAFDTRWRYVKNFLSPTGLQKAIPLMELLGKGRGGKVLKFLAMSGLAWPQFDIFDKKRVKYAIKTVIYKSLGPPDPTHPHLVQLYQIKPYFLCLPLAIKGTQDVMLWQRVFRHLQMLRLRPHKSCSSVDNRVEGVVSWLLWLSSWLLWLLLWLS